jgi:hypothetical protein
MKKKLKIFFLTLLGFFVVQLKAQTAPKCYPEINNSTTNPANSADPRGEPWINLGEFDWRNNNWWLWHPTASSTNPSNLISPFYQDPSQINVGHLSHQNPDNKVANGWELITYRLGTEYKDASPGNPPLVLGEGFPLIMLYNKFTGTIRVFVYVLHSNAALPNLATGWQTALLRIRYYKSNDIEYKMNANLSLNNGKVNALDAWLGNDTLMQANTLMVGEEGDWVMADFQTMYDPCVCHFKSAVVVDMKLIQKSQVILSGRVDTDEEKYADVQGKGSSTQNVNTYDQVKGTIVKVNESVKSITETAKGVGEFTSLLFKTKDDFEVPTLANLFSSTEQAAIVSSLTGAVPYIGAAIGLIDFFIAGGKKETSESTLPTIIHADIKVNGNIITEDISTPYTVTTPGSKINNLNSLYQPMYNEALGVFNLVETPVLEYVEYKDRTIEGPDILTPPIVIQYKQKNDIKYVVNPASGLEVESIEAAYVFKYNENVFEDSAERYAENQRKLSWFGNVPFLDNWIEHNYSPPLNHYNADRFVFFPQPFVLNKTDDKLTVPMHLSTYFPTYPSTMTRDDYFKEYLKEINSKGFDVDNFTNDWTKLSAITLNTRYKSLSCLKSEAFSFWSGYALEPVGYMQQWNDNEWKTIQFSNYLAQEHPWKLPEIYLKLNIVLKRKDDPNAQKVRIIYTYNTKIIESEQNSNSKNRVKLKVWKDAKSQPDFKFNGYLKCEFTHGSAGTDPGMLFESPLRIPKSLSFLNQTIGPGDIVASTEIIIGDGTVIQPGTHFIAPKVNITPSVHLPSGCTIKHSICSDCDRNVAELQLMNTDFCTDPNKYHPDGIGTSAPPDSSNKDEKDIITKNVGLYTKIYPNPSTGVYFIKSNYVLEGAVISVLDFTGKQVKQFVGETLDENIIDLTEFSDGLYFVIIRQSGLESTQKVLLLRD